MSVKTAGVGHFTIPTAPAAGTSCTSGAANVFTTNYVQLIASTAAALFITGIYVEEAAVTAGTYIIVQLATGGAGHFIAGSNAGTTTFGALTVTGATTLTGNVALADGLTIAAPSTGNRAGLDIAGNGTGAALKLVAGATGVGLSVAGGGTSGDGIKVTTTSGHGVNLAPVGTSMHGLLATGGNGGTSDGIKAAAGTGGVDLRANQTGNVTGNVSGSVGSVTGAVGSVTGAVGSVTGLTASNLDATVSSRLASASYTAPLSAGATANAVWDELTATHTGVGSTGLALTTASALGQPLTAAGTRAALGMASANLDTQLGALATSAQAVAIKAKTDSLTFTVAGKLDVNVLVINGVTVTGLGTSAVPWGPA